jgi:hypothetical protein
LVERNQWGMEMKRGKGNENLFVFVLILRGEVGMKTS